MSEVSSEATAALAALDAVALGRLAARLQEIAQSQHGGVAAIEPEPQAAVAAAQTILRDVLDATGQNIQVLQRLQDRKVKAVWERSSRC